MLHGIIVCPFGAGGITYLIIVIPGVAFLTTSVASKLFLGGKCTVYLIFSLLVLAVAAQLITVALLIIIVPWIYFVVGQCISSFCNRPGFLILE